MTDSPPTNRNIVRLTADILACDMEKTQLYLITLVWLCSIKLSAWTT